MKNVLAQAKPYIVGGIIGAVALTIVAFSAGWVVTAGSTAEQVQAARVEALAAVCSARGLASWTAKGNDLEALDGWSNDEREALATASAPKIDSLAALHDEVVDLCDDRLREA